MTFLAPANSNRLRALVLVLSGLMLSTAEAKAPSAATENQVQEPLLLNAAGSTFLNPLFVKWFREYNRLRPEIEVNYQSIGSGGGVRQLKKGTVAFAATDIPLSQTEKSQFSGELAQFPVILGAVAIAYNLPGQTPPQGELSQASSSIDSSASTQLSSKSNVSHLRLSGPVIAQIARGQITYWDAPEIRALNPKMKLPHQEIVFVYRSDSSGTTGVFTDYLGRVDRDFDRDVGIGKSVKWPTGIGGKGNEGVTAHIKNIEGSIGYLELTYAIGQKLGRAEIQNAAGKFVEAELSSVTEAASSGLKVMGPDAVGSIVNAGGDRSYPISAFAYVVMELSGKDQKSPTQKKEQAEALKLLAWGVDRDAQEMAKSQGYAPLPSEVQRRTQERIQALMLK